MEEIMLKIDNVSKKYVLGQIGGTTLRDELQRFGAKIRGREDPTRMIGVRDYKTGDTFKALDGVSFEIKKGERVGIIGHNGAGKSTLLKLISRVTAPTGGTIGLNGRVASMLEVDTGFHGELTGRENVYMNGAILGMTKKEIDAKLEDIIEFSECRQFIDTPVKRYSSGMYVKLAFSVAAHLDSEIMIMDEVLAVGDMAFQKKCLDKMNSVSKTEGRTILYVSHNMTTIRQLCDRVIVLNHGKVSFDGDVETGIETYLGTGNANEFPTEYDFKDIPRSCSFGKEIFAESFHFCDSDVAEFGYGEKIGFEIKISSTITRDNVRCVLRIKDRNNTALIAAALSKGFHVSSGKTESYYFELDINGLIPDVYSFSFELIQYDYSGNYHPYDNPGAMMPVRINKDNDTIMNWSTKYWGNVALPEMKVTTYLSAATCI